MLEVGAKYSFCPQPVAQDEHGAGYPGRFPESSDSQENPSIYQLSA